MPSNPPDCSYIIWGAGGGGKAAHAFLHRHGAKACAFIDRNPALFQTYINGVKVYSPQDLAHLKQQNTTIIIASAFHHEISSDLDRLGLEAGKDYLTIDEYRRIFLPGGKYPPGDFVNKSIKILNQFKRIKEVKILHLGSGPFLGVDLALLLAGAQTVTCLDILRIPMFPEITKAAGYYEDFINQLLAAEEFKTYLPNPGEINFDNFFLQSANGIEIKTNRLQFHRLSAEKIPEPSNTFDYVFSNAVFEHLANPDVVIDEIYRVLKPGGITFHQIDLRDHRDFAKPYAFLSMSRKQWQEQQEPKDYCSGSQRRGIEYVHWLKEKGFKVNQYLPQTNLLDHVNEPLDLKKLHADFHHFTEEDLLPLSCFIRATKHTRI